MPSLVGGSASELARVGPVVDRDENPPSSRKTNIATRGLKTNPSIVHEETEKQLQVVELTEKKAIKAMTSFTNDPVALPASTSILKSKKRKVTPSGDPESKQFQQKKVSQMSLSSFFLPCGNKDAATPPSKVNKRASTPHQQTLSVLEQLSLPRKRPLNIPSKLDALKGSSPSASDAKTIATTKAEEKFDTDMNDTATSTNGESQHGERFQDEDAIIVHLSSNTDETTEENKPVNVDESEANDICKRISSKKRFASKSKSKPTDEKTKSLSEPLKQLTEVELSEDRLTMLKNYRIMKERYLERAAQLISQAKNSIEEETFDVPNLEHLGEGKSLDDDDFPTRVVSNLALLIEGR
jgi:hypothetical protein